MLLYGEALEVARNVGDRMRQAVILTNLGESHYRLEKPTDAIRVLKQAEDISSTLDMPIGSIGPTRARILSVLRREVLRRGVTSVDSRL